MNSMQMQMLGSAKKEPKQEMMYCDWQSCKICNSRRICFLTEDLASINTILDGKDKSVMSS
jgi:hypothetical protein